MLGTHAAGHPRR